MTAQLSSASGVDAPRCGMGITLSILSSSSSGKSVTYAATVPSLMAALRSSFFTSPPRAKLRMPHAFFHERELVFVDHALGLVVERHMQRDVVRLGKEAVEPQRALDSPRQLPRGLNRNERIVPGHLHAQRHRVVGHLHADGAEPDHAEPFALDFRALEIGLALLNELGHLVALSGQPLCPLCPERLACDDISSAAMTSSLTLLALAPGVFITTTPFWEHLSTGMLLTPAPARAMALSDSGNSISCMSALRTSTRRDARSPTRFRSCHGENLEAHGGNLIQCLNFEHVVLLYLLECLSAFPAGKVRFETPICLPAAWLIRILHEINKLLHSFNRHGVVDAGAHAAHASMAFELHQAVLLRLLEALVGHFVRGGKRHVHDRTVSVATVPLKSADLSRKS